MAHEQLLLVANRSAQACTFSLRLTRRIWDLSAMFLDDDATPPPDPYRRPNLDNRASCASKRAPVPGDVLVGEGVAPPVEFGRAGSG